MTEQEFKQKKKEVGFIEGDLTMENVSKVFTILDIVEDREKRNYFYSSSIDWSKAGPLDYSLPQYQKYAKK